MGLVLTEVILRTIIMGTLLGLGVIAGIVMIILGAIHAAFWLVMATIIYLCFCTVLEKVRCFFRDLDG
jgi:hypothetical protein